MMTVYHGHESDKTSENDPVEDPGYPPAGQSLKAIKALLGGMRGQVTIQRAKPTLSPGIWTGVAKFHLDIDIELEVDGRSLNEVIYALLDSVQMIVGLTGSSEPGG